MNTIMLNGCAVMPRQAPRPLTAVERALSCSDLLGHIVHHLVGSYAGRPVRESERSWQQYRSDWLIMCLEQVLDWSHMRLWYLSGGILVMWVKRAGLCAKRV